MPELLGFQHIRCLERLAAEQPRIFSRGTKGTLDWAHVEYFPGNGQIDYHSAWMKRNALAHKVSRYDTRSLSEEEYVKLPEPVITAIDELNLRQDISRNMQERYSHIATLVNEIMLEAPVSSLNELQTDAAYLQTEDVSDGSFTGRLFIYSDKSLVGDSYSSSGLKTVQLIPSFIANVDEESYVEVSINRYSNNPWKPVLRPGTITMKTTAQGNIAVGAINSFGYDRVTQLFQLTPEQLRKFRQYFPKEIFNPLMELGDIEKDAVITALHALQYTRWGKYEGEGPDADNPHITDETFKAAIRALYSRFPPEKVDEGIMDMVRKQMKMIHGKLVEPINEYKAHSDASILNTYQTEYATDLIFNLHPIAQAMLGYLSVNEMSMFGERALWELLFDEHPELYTSLVWLMQTEQGEGHKYAIDMPGLLRDHFPEVFEFIIEHDPNFIPVTNPGECVIRPDNQ